MAARYNDINTIAGSLGDFIVRRRIPTLTQLLLIFAGTFIVAISLVVTTMDKLALGIVLVILFAAVGSYVVVQIQRSRDLVLTTEFQNALFASALGINNKFCLIIRQDGIIVYLDRSFQEMFPDFIKQPRRTVGMLLSCGKLSQEDSKKVFSAIERGVYDKVAFGIHDAEGNFHKLIMSIEPILRPSGFILLRGREFMERHNEEQAGEPTPAFNKSTITLFSHVMDTMDMGVYMAGPEGDFIYANPVLEQWLGFKEGEIASRNLSLKDIIRSSNPDFTFHPGNYEGTVLFEKRGGGIMAGFINQKIIRNDQDKMIGYVALVHNTSSAQNIERKKKLW